MNRLFIFISTFVFVMSAAASEITVSKTAQLKVTSILGANIGSQVVQLLLKPLPGKTEGYSEALPDHCILNANAQIAGGQLKVIPTNLVCITEDKRILEGLIEGSASPVGRLCESGCTTVQLEANMEFEIELVQDLQLTLQKRADQAE